MSPAQIRAFCRFLGWPAPKRWTHVTPEGDTVVWYEATDAQSSTLHINLTPLQACVVSARYRIRSGFHAIQPGKGRDALRKEALRLSPYLHSIWLRDAASRRAFRLMLPDAANWTRERVLRENWQHIR